MVSTRIATDSENFHLAARRRLARNRSGGRRDVLRPAAMARERKASAQDEERPTPTDDVADDADDGAVDEQGDTRAEVAGSFGAWLGGAWIPREMALLFGFV